MGYIYVDIAIKGRRGSMNLRTLVDTGSAHIVLKPEIITQLGLYETPYEIELTSPDSGKIRSKLYLAEIECKGRKGPALIVEANVPIPLLGIYSLETLGLKPNPVTGEVEIIGQKGDIYCDINFSERLGL